MSSFPKTSKAALKNMKILSWWGWRKILGLFIYLKKAAELQFCTAAGRKKLHIPQGRLMDAQLCSNQPAHGQSISDFASHTTRNGRPHVWARMHHSKAQQKSRKDVLSLDVIKQATTLRNVTCYPTFIHLKFTGKQSFFQFEIILNTP